MKVLLLTDIHGNEENLKEIISREDYDAVLCAGDLSDANEFDDYSQNLERILDILEEGSGLVKAIPGNMDPEEGCVQALIKRSMNLHKNVESFGEFEAVGFGGGQTPFDTPFEPSEDEIRETVELLHNRMSSDVKVAVIHQPPKDTDLDIVEDDHVGSSEVRALLENQDFDLLLTGHIHQSRGIDELSDTLMVNPGPVNQGYYGVLTVEDGLDVELRSL